MFWDIFPRQDCPDCQRAPSLTPSHVSNSPTLPGFPGKWSPCRMSSRVYAGWSEI